MQLKASAIRRDWKATLLVQHVVDAERSRALLARWALVAVVVGLIEWLVATGRIGVLFIARPSEVGARFLALLSSDLVPLTLVTLLEVGVSLASAAVTGLGLGYLMWRFQSLGRGFEVLLGALFASPLVLLYPIALVFLGRTSAAVVAMSAGIAVIPIALQTRASLAGVSPVFIRYARTILMAERQVFLHILLPAAAPGIFNGMRLGLLYVFKVVLSMEFIVGIGGLGRLISVSYDMLRTADLYAAILSVVGLSFFYLWVLEWTERRIRRSA